MTPVTRSIQTSSSQTENRPKEDARANDESLGSKIWGVVQKILLGLANSLFFITNPTLYAIGFLAGFTAGLIWPKQVQIIVDKIILLWEKQWYIMVPVTCAAAFLSIQVTWAAVSVMFATHLGATLAQKANDLWDNQIEEKQKEKAPQDTFKLVE